MQFGLRFNLAEKIMCECHETGLCVFHSSREPQQPTAEEGESVYLEATGGGGGGGTGTRPGVCEFVSLSVSN